MPLTHITRSYTNRTATADTVAAAACGVCLSSLSLVALLVLRKRSTSYLIHLSGTRPSTVDSY